LKDPPPRHESLRRKHRVRAGCELHRHRRITSALSRCP
jgi:hypothetical protein